VLLHSLAVSSPRGLRLLAFLFVVLAVSCSSALQTAAASGQLTVSPQILDFQTVVIGQRATLLCHIQNTGSTTVRVYSVSSSKSEFQLAGPSLPVSLAPSEAIDFNIMFEPAASGKTSALLEIVSSAQAMQSYTLTGSGKDAAGALQLSPSSLNFGSQDPDSVSTRNVVVLNAGEIPLTISGVTVMGSGFAFSNVSPGLTLAPKERVTVQVSFRPQSGEVASGKLTILSKDLASAATLPLAGSGVIPAPATSSPALVNAVFVTRSSAPGSPSVASLTPSTSTPSVSSAALVTRTSAASTPSAAMAAFAVPASSPSTIRPALTSSSGPKTVLLQWGASPSPVNGYRVYRGTVSGGPYVDQTSGALPALNYNDTSVTAGSTYYYVVTSIDSNGVESAYSNEAKAAVPSSGGTTTTPPPSTTTASVPTSLTSGIAMNGSAAVNGTRLRLTSTSGTNLAGSGWFTNPLNIQTFSTTFTFQIANTTTNPMGNGFTFVLQNAGTKALGPSGGGLGYGPDNVNSPDPSSNAPIAKSVAIKFDTVNNAGEGTNSTGLYINGASPTTPATPLGGGVNLRSGDIFKVVVSYDGTKLRMIITDTANTAQTCTTSWTVNIPGTVGGNTAYVGFTGGTGNSVANQDIITWTYGSNTPTSTTSKTPIVYKSTGLKATSSGPTFRTFAYASFPDGNGTILDSTKAGDNVTFTVNVPSAGTYDLKLSYKQYINRGISQLAINGTSMGAPLDQYLSQEGYAIFDYGNFTFSAAGNYSFKFTILGKDASATGYTVSFDDFTLTPQ
jgi:Legume lectin domain/Transmembrane protein 131-like N-terminal/Abnormal spindle-like microcephaly-assoc'd, ASPM-SPD-2-Hydin